MIGQNLAANAHRTAWNSSIVFVIQQTAHGILISVMDDKTEFMQGRIYNGSRGFVQTPLFLDISLLEFIQNLVIQVSSGKTSELATVLLVAWQGYMASSAGDALTPSARQ